MATTPTRRKRRLGSYLRALRERSGRTAEDAAETLDKSRPSVTRIESGDVLPRKLELQALLADYGASAVERTEARALWEDAKQDSARLELPTTLPPKYRALVRAEADAERLQTIATTAVDGLLQTPHYARAIHESPSGFRVPAERTKRALDVRMSRQNRLRGPAPLSVHALMDEAVIRRVVGGPEVMAGQLRHLLDTAELDNVTIQVIPYSAGAYGSMSGGLSILSFDAPEDPPAVYLEYPGGGAWLEDSEDVGKFTAMFDAVAAAALTPAATRKLINDQINVLEGR